MFMNKTNIGQIKRDYLIASIFLQLVTCLTIFLNIPIARQVLGFVYFTFVPGYVILKLLKLDDFDWEYKILFSVGFSVAFLMLVGLVLSESLSVFGLSQPLSLIPLMIGLNSLILAGIILTHLRRINVKTLEAQPDIESPKSPLMLAFLLLPILSIVGTIYVNIYENNLILLVTVVLISTLFVCGFLSKKLLPSKYYPLVVLMIAIALIYHTSLISSYILSYGSDAPREYFVFGVTKSSGQWSSTSPFPGDAFYGRYYSMLSITILPTIYSNLLNMDQMLFKAVIPLIFSLVPLGLYQLWKGYVGKRYAFISAFLFMAGSTFYVEIVSLNREIIAELFFILLFIVMLNNKMKPTIKLICFMFFSFGLVVSHYSIAGIFLFSIAFTLISLIILKRPSQKITIPMVFFFSVLMLSWFIYTAESATFSSFLQFGDNLRRQFGDFFSLSSRGQGVLEGIGLAESPSFLNTISRMFAYITEAFIVVGFIALLTKRKKIKIETEYFLLSSAAMCILLLVLLVPGLANAFNITRFYHMLLFFLAPFFTVGVAFLMKMLFKRKSIFLVSVFMLIIIVPYFLFQTNFVYEVAGSRSWSVPLSGYRMDPVDLYGSNGYIDSCTAYGAQWLSTYINRSSSQLYADEKENNNVLAINGLGYSMALTNKTVVAESGIVYLGSLNIIGGGITFGGRLSWNSSEIAPIFEDMNVIYANGGSVVLKHSP